VAKLEHSEKREVVDPLTCLPNRLEIEGKIEGRMLWRRVFCLAILDLNGFKQINDVYGHPAGDDLLKQFAGELKAQFRLSDLIGRWDIDEFVVVIDSGIEEARASLDRVRKLAFGDYKIVCGMGIVEVTLNASIGVAVWDGKENAVELLARAVERMHDDKRMTSMPKSPLSFAQLRGANTGNLRQGSSRKVMAWIGGRQFR
jgi:diguanylate cyclase (GGDEF)-like protein